LYVANRRAKPIVSTSSPNTALAAATFSIEPLRRWIWSTSRLRMKRIILARSTWRIAHSSAGGMREALRHQSSRGPAPTQRGLR
jgi:hypothetical protein